MTKKKKILTVLCHSLFFYLSLKKHWSVRLSHFFCSSNNVIKFGRTPLKASLRVWHVYVFLSMLITVAGYEPNYPRLYLHENSVTTATARSHLLSLPHWTLICSVVDINLILTIFFQGSSHDPNTELKSLAFFCLLPVTSQFS